MGRFGQLAESSLSSSPAKQPKMPFVGQFQHRTNNYVLEALPVLPLIPEGKTPQHQVTGGNLVAAAQYFECKTTQLLWWTGYGIFSFEIDESTAWMQRVDVDSEPSPGARVQGDIDA